MLFGNCGLRLYFCQCAVVSRYCAESDLRAETSLHTLNQGSILELRYQGNRADDLDLLNARLELTNCAIRNAKAKHVLMLTGSL